MKRTHHYECKCKECYKKQETLSELREKTKKQKVDAINHPKHYTSHKSGIECIDVTENFNFCLGNVLKYVWRADHKGQPIEDLEKALWYLTNEIKRRKKMLGK